MMRSWTTSAFVLANVAIWLVMTAILVLVPDVLERWVGLDVARVIAWTVACGVWVVTIESQWKARVGPIKRFVFQLLLWIAAALVALWIRDLVTM